MFLVDLENEGLVVFPTHRMVYGLDNFNEDQIINKLQMHFKTEKIPVSDDDKTKEIEKTLSQSEKGTFILYTGKNYFHKITLRNKDIMKNMLPDKSEAYQD